MMPLQVELQRNVKATKDEAMTVEQAAELLKVHRTTSQRLLLGLTI